MQIKWTELALDDLIAIQSYISKDSNFTPSNLLNRSSMQSTTWKTFPKSGGAYQKQEKEKMCGN